MNKSLVTNLTALILMVLGYVLQDTLLLMMGLFALSGAITNWLAIYMLFEKIPGLVGSGVIPNRFQEFKSAIKSLMMEQFFTQENIDKFVANTAQNSKFELKPIIEKVDLTPSYERLVEVIMNSSFGSMLGMFGGADALKPLKEPFLVNMKNSLIEMTQTDEFHQMLQEELDQPDVMADIKMQVANIIDARLEELTPQLVKEIVQKMIKQHLGWLVVWGGVFGGLIGLITSVFMMMSL